MYCAELQMPATHQGPQAICKACGLIKKAGSSAVHCRMLARGSLLIPGSKASRGHALELGSEKLLLVLTIKGRRGELESLCKGKESKRCLGGKGDRMLSARLKAWSAQLCRDLQCLSNLQKTIGFEQKGGEILCLGSSDCSKFKVGR